MKTIKIGTLALGHMPRVAVVVDRILPLDKIMQSKEQGASLLELRFDCFQDPADRVFAYVRELRAQAGLPMIGTIRETDRNRDERMGLFERAMPLIDAVDIEIDTPINAAVIAVAEGKTIIVSEHDYEKTPEDDRLGHIVETAVNLGADIVKIATMAHSHDDVVRLLTFTHSRPECMVAIAMGDFGSFSRIAAPMFGSVLTYTFLDEAVAPGQLPFHVTIEELRRYYPGFSSHS
jgi:3-dehydroquinate dehydratase-1